MSGKKAKKQNNEVLPQNTAGSSGIDGVEISKLLEDFVNDPNQKAYTFKTVMNTVERARVHLLCKKMNICSESSGKGKNRYVTVYKTDETYGGQSSVKSLNSETSDEGTQSNSFAFSEESKRVLMYLFMCYPPREEKIGEQKLTYQTRNTSESRGRIDDTFLRPRMSMAEIARKVDSLFLNVKRVPQLAKIYEKRSKLPIASFRDEITSTIANHQVVLIVGETGCGKTTQVPQYLLDDMWVKGKACKIVCTQPRRISAVSVSERIAQERGETIGDSVGYKIRLEARGGRESSILFCTSGVLLKVLTSSRECEPGESSVKAEKCISELTHIVVDEIHERDRYSDLMLTILRDLLPAHPHLRLVLMSATIDAERFSEYFGGCPVVRVPGFTHPVKTYYLEEVLSMLKTPQSNHLNATPTVLTSSSNEPKMSEEYQGALDEAVELLLLNEGFDSLLEIISSQGKLAVLNHKHSSTGVTPLMIFAGKGSVSDVGTLLSLGADCLVKAHDGTTALDWAKHGDQTEVVEIITKHMETLSSGLMEEQQLLHKYMKRANTDVIDNFLIEKLLRKICTDSLDGAILVFLPGWEDISRIQNILLAISFFNDPTKFLVLPLHSMVPSAEQKKVFQPPPPGCRKIILSTNIAETSVTIDDVVYVIDSGHMKEQSYDPLNNVSTLQSSWISKASAKQREGRAGRCQPGVCFHLYSKLKAVSLADFQVPEIKRMAIDELCLQVKMLYPNCKLVDVLNRTLDPPVLKTINNAIAALQNIGALSQDEQLTDLGKKLGSLPVHPAASNMLFAGILLNCLGPALTLACAADYRNPFTLPMLPSDKHKADEARAKLASLYGGKSDQLATVAAFDCWESAKKRGMESWFCSEYFLSKNIMSMLSGMRKHLLNELQRCGFVPSDSSTCNLYSRDPGILQAVLVAGLYPRIGKFGSRGKFSKFVEISSGMRARLLSRSILTKFSQDELCGKHGQGPLLLYDEVTQGDMGLQVRSCTVISPLPLLLFAKEICVVSGDEMRNDTAKEDEVGKSDSIVDDGDKKVSLGNGKSGIPVDSDKNDSDIGRTGSHDDVKSDGPVNGDTRSLEDTSKEGILTSPDSSVIVVVDGWVSFKMTALEVAQIYCLRERLSDALLFKISNPKRDLPPVLVASIFAIICLMSYNGVSGNSLPMALGDIDILTTLLNTGDVINKKKDHLQDVPISGQPLLVDHQPGENPISASPLLVGEKAPPRPTLQKIKGKNEPKKVGEKAGESPQIPIVGQQPSTVEMGPCVQASGKRKSGKKPKKMDGGAEERVQIPIVDCGIPSLDPPQSTTSPAPPPPTTMTSTAPPQQTTKASGKRKRGKKTKKMDGGAEERVQIPIVDCGIPSPDPPQSTTTPAPPPPTTMTPTAPPQPTTKVSGKRKRGKKPKKMDGGAEERVQIPIVDCGIPSPDPPQSTTTPAPPPPAMTPPAPPPPAMTSVTHRPPTMTSPAPLPPTIASPAPLPPTTMTSTAPPQPTTKASGKRKRGKKPKKMDGGDEESLQIPIVDCGIPSSDPPQSTTSPAPPPPAMTSPAPPMVEKQPNAGTVDTEHCVQISGPAL